MNLTNEQLIEILKTTIIVDEYGTIRWYLNGQLHRTDGPAIEYINGAKMWCFNNQLHRTDGPAIEDNNGNKFWYLNGKLHRTDGPAFEDSVTKEWYINGEQVTEDEFNERTIDI